MITNLKRKSHLLASEMSRRSSYATNSSYPLSDDTFTNRAIHNPTARHLDQLSLSHSTHYSQSPYTMPRELQQTYVKYFKQTLKSRTTALSKYTKTRYSPIHKKYWRDIFLYMSNGKQHLDRSKFKEGIERCGIKIRTDKKSSRKKNTEQKQKEVEEILNAVFVEMDFDNTGYITVHAFTSMMMNEDTHLRSSDSSSSYYMNPNTNNANPASSHLYNTYSSYGYSETATLPRKSYEHMAVANGGNGNVHHNHAYNYGYHNPRTAPHRKEKAGYLRPDPNYFGTYNPHSNMYSSTSSDKERFIKNKKKKRKKKRRHHKNSSGQYDQYHAPNQFVEQEYSLSSDEEQQRYYEEVEEKTHKIHQNPASHHSHDELYLNNTWNDIQTRDGYAQEEQDEKIPMLEVVNSHMKSMGIGADNHTIKTPNKSKGKSKKSKKKSKKQGKSKHKQSNLSKMSRKSTNGKSIRSIPTFEVTRQKLSALDLIERRYYLHIDRESEKVILSPTNDYALEIECEFGLHQVIVGDYQSTLIQIKTLSGKHIFYEFDVRQNKDEFVDLLDEIKHESNQRSRTRSRLSSSERLPRGSGFPDFINPAIVEDDVDPNFYEDECSICRATLCTPSTFYWFIGLSIIHISVAYLYANYFHSSLKDFISLQNVLLIWILINMIVLRISAVGLIRKKCTLCCAKVFDCIWCHRFAFYGFSSESLMTVWTIFWLAWITIIVAEQVWKTSNTPIQVVSFGFVVLSLTFLVFAQFAYCRCRCCTKTLSNLLHSVLARLACCFMAIYGVLNIVSTTTDLIIIAYDPGFWLSVVLLLEFLIYFISVCVLQKNQLEIKGKDVSLRVMSDDLAEIQIPFNIDPFSYIWLSDDRAQWIKLPILSTTISKSSLNKSHKNKLSVMNRLKSNPKINVEKNPYHHQQNSSGDIELQTMTDIYKNKTRLKHTLSRSKNKYEAVGQGRVIDYNERDRTGFVVGSMDDTIEELMSNDNDDECGLIIHSRNKMGKRMIENLSYCYEESSFPIYIKKYDSPLTIMCFAFVYKRIGIIATDDRIIPAISYILYNNNNNNKQYIDLLWLVNKPQKQYNNLYQLLQLNKNKNIKIVDMTKKKTSKEKQIGIFLKNISSQAIFALTSRHQGLRIKKESKHALVYIQHTEWY